MANGSGLFQLSRPRIPHLSVAGKSGVAGELADLRQDIDATLKPLAALTVDEFTAPVAADVDGIKLAALSTLAASAFVAADLDGVVGDNVMDPPRNITITNAGTGTAADAPASATVTGIDVNGAVMSETISVPQTGTIVEGVKCFRKVTGITMPVGQGTGATISFGFGALLGLGKKARSRAGLVPLALEVMSGAYVTTGSLSSPSTNAPHGAYTPAAAPNAARNYAIWYELDAR